MFDDRMIMPVWFCLACVMSYGFGVSFGTGGVDAALCLQALAMTGKPQ